MIKKKFDTRKLLITFLSILLVFSLYAFLAIGIPYEQSFAYEVSPNTLEDEYIKGSSLTLPTRTVTVGGENVEASYVLCYPSGRAIADKNVTLDEVGAYKIYYSADVNGKKVAFEEDFTVIQTMATYGAKTSATYGLVKGFNDISGLNVRLAKGDTLTINEIIDISEATKDDTLISAFVTTDVKGANDFTRLIFTFTDISDPSTYFSISSRSTIDGLAGNCTWVQAGANGQPYAGYYSRTNTIFVGGTWGAQIGHSFFSYYYDAKTKEEIEGYYGEKELRFNYDNASKTLYVIDNLRTETGLFDLVNKVADFDDSDFFTTLWRGFKSGKARLSVTAEGLVGETANFVITELYNVDLSKTAVTKYVNPTITVDDTLKTMPKAKVGGTYIIPNASAVDSKNEKCDVAVGVWYNYTSSQNAVMIDVKDNVFETKYSGLYTIVYTATDKEGNQSTYELWVETDNNILPPAITLPSGRVTQTNTGEMVEFKEPTIVNGSGKKELLTSLKYNGTETFIENSYRFMKAGQYTLTYYFTDYVGQKTQSSYQINVVNGANPIFIEKPVFDDYFITNTSYDLPRIIASDFSSGEEQKVPATITVTDKNGTRQIFEGDKYVPAVENNFDNITIKYKALNSELVYEIPTVLAYAKTEGSSRTRLQIQNYFVGEGINIVKTSSGSTVTATSSNGNWTFANKLVAEKFSYSFKSVTGKSLFDALKITLKDSVDKSISVTVTIAKDKTKSLISYNGESKEIDEGFTTSSISRNFEFTYKDKTVIIGKGILDILFDDNGKVFTGFPSQKIIFSVAFENANVGSEYFITSINGQPINDATSDRISPKIVLLSEMESIVPIDSQYTLPLASVGDVLDPNTSVSVSVYTPSGKVAKTVDGISLAEVSANKAYTIFFDEYGVYNIEYHSKDAFGAPEAILYSSVTIEDCIPPTIELLASFKPNAKVGDTIVIPKIKVSDNLTKVDDIIVRTYVYSPNGSLITIPNNSNSFKCIYEGEYEFRFVAMDKIGNVTVTKVKVTVTK